ncbi:MAG: hypothetical protein DWB56_06655 [Candidatus Jettenia sp.]|uniref:helix-turn-helix domain-containing protein n=1 Tax=Candidatus Jettenia sp. AMX1 TaxID=2293637 RepID=UPI0009FBC29B|nr:MAG: hypothetical protein EDM77_03595 [Candidatus Jettenia sp. AMX1]MBC6928634.1 hypothetical protein [Candidatus Jettenia sp.]MCQ3926728.1 hypothetical protein [Candidatus Jettenia sp.]MDL1938465.1 bacteriophage CI repressor [Candidatus Jettenia sp. AMX1]
MKLILDKKDINIIIHRLMTYTNARSETELARILGMSQSALAERKKKESFPYEHVIPFCISRGISLDLIFENRLNEECKKKLIEEIENTDISSLNLQNKQNNTQVDPHKVAAAADPDHRPSRSGGIGRRARFRV